MTKPIIDNPLHGSATITLETEDLQSLTDRQTLSFDGTLVGLNGMSSLGGDPKRDHTRVHVDGDLAALDGDQLLGNEVVERLISLQRRRRRWRWRHVHDAAKVDALEAGWKSKGAGEQHGLVLASQLGQ